MTQYTVRMRDAVSTPNYQSVPVEASTPEDAIKAAFRKRDAYRQYVMGDCECKVFPGHGGWHASDSVLLEKTVEA